MLSLKGTYSCNFEALCYFSITFTPQESVKSGTVWNYVRITRSYDISHISPTPLSLQTIESLNSGKPFLPTLFVDLQGTIKTLRYFAGYADKIHGTSIPMGKNQD